MTTSPQGARSPLESASSSSATCTRRSRPGAPSRVAYELFRASLDAGHDAHLVCALEADHEAAYGKPGAPIVPMHGEERQYFFFPQFYDFLHLSVGDWRALRFFRELVERLEPDVVHFHHYHRIGVETIRAARVAAPQATICLTFHEMMAICLADGQMLKRPSRELCRAATPIDCNRCFPDLRPEFMTLRAERLKAVLSDVDRFVFPSEFLADRYVDWGLPGGKCAVIPNGQEDLAGGFDKRQHSAPVNRFGFFGQFIDNKGIDVILEALIIMSKRKTIPPQGIVVEINGANENYATAAYLDRVRGQFAEIARLAAGPISIRNAGSYTRAQLADRMRAVDWVVVPSTWWEVFGLVASEAWMFGRPVIASDIGGLGERVEHGSNGIKFRARDAEALSTLMVSLVGREGDWLRMNGQLRTPWTAAEMLAAHIALWNESEAVTVP